MTVLAGAFTPTTTRYTAALDFVRHPKGQIVADNLENIRLALQRLDVVLSYDQFASCLRLNGAATDDAAVETLWARIDDTFHFRPALPLLHTLIGVESRKRAHHPVRTYLEGLTWDGGPRLDTWLIDYAGAPDTAYVRAVSVLPLLAAVRRTRVPGEKFDELLVLESGQGDGKSSVVRALCPDDSWFSDDLPLGVDSKEVIERTNGRWLIEAADMHGQRGRAAEQLKAFLSRQTDGPCRLAYHRLSVSVPRQFIIIGTTNQTMGYLKDSTGGRRFWPVTVGRIDVDGLAAIRDDLWAEAVALEATPGTSIHLDRSLWGVAGEQQEQRRAADPWEAELAELLARDSGDDEIPVKNVWNALGVEVNAQDNRAADRVTAIVQRYGFTEKRNIWQKDTGRTVYCWVRPCL